jgi:hypothetical protein
MLPIETSSQALHFKKDPRYHGSNRVLRLRPTDLAGVFCGAANFAVSDSRLFFDAERACVRLCVKLILSAPIFLHFDSLDNGSTKRLADTETL